MIFLVFCVEELEKLQETNFTYSEQICKTKVTTILNAQKFVNRAILNAAKANIPVGNCNEYTQQSRFKKVQKQDSWIQKSFASITDDLELPRVPGTDKLKVLRSVVTIKQVKRLATGETVVTDILT